MLKTGIKMSSNTESLKTFCRNCLITRKVIEQSQRQHQSNLLRQSKKSVKQKISAQSHKILIVADLALYPDDPGCIIQSLKPFYEIYRKKCELSQNISKCQFGSFWENRYLVPQPYSLLEEPIYNSKGMLFRQIIVTMHKHTKVFVAVSYLLSIHRYLQYYIQCSLLN